jgi:hypothetical protein
MIRHRIFATPIQPARWTSLTPEGLGLRHFAPEGTFLDSRVRGNDEDDGSGEGNGEPGSRLSKE